MVTHTINKEPASSSVSDDRDELVITRIFGAPRDRVWKAWTDPRELVKWWGPKDYTSPVCRIDLRVGGKYLFSMRSPEGRVFWSTGEYREIVDQERIVYSDSFSNENGDVVPATFYGMNEDFPLCMHVVATFAKSKGSTVMALKHIGLPRGSMTEQTAQGWNESFDKLDESL